MADPYIHWDIEKPEDRERYLWPRKRVIAWWEKALEEGWATLDQEQGGDPAFAMRTEADKKLLDAMQGIGLKDWYTCFGTDESGQDLYWDPFHLPLFDPRTGDLSLKHASQHTGKDTKKVYEAFHEALAEAIWERMEEGKKGTPANCRGFVVHHNLSLGASLDNLMGQDSEIALRTKHRNPNFNPTLYINFSGSLLGQDIVLSYRQFGDDGKITGGHITPSLKFDNASIGGDVRFEGARIRGNGWFARVCIGGSAWFGNAIIGGRAFFDHASIGESALFDRADIGGDVWFERANIGKRVNFVCANIGVDACFESAYIGGEAEFERSSIGRNAWFDNSVIGDDAGFTGANIGGHTRFGNATIGGRVLFWNASIGRDIRFNGVRIDQDAFFGHANINGHAKFEAASIGGEVSFGSALIGGLVIFSNAELLSMTNFGLGAPSQNLSSNHMRIEQVKSNDEAAEHLTFAVTRNMNDEPGWQLAAAFPSRVDFSGAIFLQGVSFQNRLFREETDFARTFFAKPPVFHDAKLHRNTSFLGAEFFPAPGTPFDRCAEHLRQRFSKDCPKVFLDIYDDIVHRLKKEPLEWDEDGLVKELNERLARYEGDEKVKSDLKRRAVALFRYRVGLLETESTRRLDRIKCRISAFFRRRQEKQTTEEPHSKRGHLDSDCGISKVGEKFEKAFQTLKIHMDQAQSRNDEQMFFALELRSRRMREDKEVKTLEKVFSYLYQITSGFGRLIWLPLCWLLVFIPLLMIPLYVLTAEWFVGPGVFSPFSLKAWLLFLYEPAFNPLVAIDVKHIVPDMVANTDNWSTGKQAPLLILAAIHRLLNVVMLFLTLLSIRRRFQIT